MYIGGENQPITFCTISDSLDHGPAAIWAYLEPVLVDLREWFPNVKVLHFQSDSPATQYRQKKNFYLFTTKLYELGFQGGTWNYSESGHGKGAPDGVGGSIKRCADQLIAQGTDLPHPISVYSEVKKHSSIKIYYVDGEKVLQEKKKYDEGPVMQSIPGTMSIHQLVSTEPTVMLYRVVSCFCSPQTGYLCQCFQPKTHRFPSDASTGVNATDLASILDVSVVDDSEAEDGGAIQPETLLKPVNFWSPALKEQHCVVDYQGKAYPGQILDITDTDAQVSCMKRVGNNRFIWNDRKPDICWYRFQSIITLIDAPVPINARHMQIEPNVWAEVRKAFK